MRTGNITDWNSIDQLCKLVDECSEVVTYTTSDGYRWRASLRFSTPTSQVIILFPEENDTRDPNGDKRDRATAMYIYGEFHVQDIEKVVLKLIAACVGAMQIKQERIDKYKSGFKIESK
jgi:hypothetical protein